MKKIYIAIVLLIICSGVCIIEQVTINKVCSETTSIINTALDLNEQKDFLKAKSQCEKLRSKDNEDELSEKLIEAKDEIQLLKENQSITLGNIF